MRIFSTLSLYIEYHCVLECWSDKNQLGLWIIAMSIDKHVLSPQIKMFSVFTCVFRTHTPPAHIHKDRQLAHRARDGFVLETGFILFLSQENPCSIFGEKEGVNRDNSC